MNYSNVYEETDDCVMRTIGINFGRTVTLTVKNEKNRSEAFEVSSDQKYDTDYSFIFYTFFFFSNLAKCVENSSVNNCALRTEREEINRKKKHSLKRSAKHDGGLKDTML